MNDRYPQSRFLRLDGDDFRNNSVPDADPGDVIFGTGTYFGALRLTKRTDTKPASEHESDTASIF